MSNCIIKGCANAAVARGLCAMHYMRQRRTGDPTSAVQKPGPKPKPGGKVEALSALMRELERLRAENAELRRQGPAAAKQAQAAKDRELARLAEELAALRAEYAELRRRSQQGPKSKDELKPAGSRTERFNPRDELGIANAKIASLRVEIRELQAKLKIKVEMPNDVVALQQQLKAARTRIHNLTVEKNTAWRKRDEARRANPVTITKANLRKLQKVFHPDPEHDTATPARKAQLNAAAVVFNALKFRVLDRD